MGSGKALHPWPAHPLPQTGESFSSWFRFFAAANGYDWVYLARFFDLSRGGIANLLALDRGLHLEGYKRIARASGLDTQTVMDMTVRRWEGRLFEDGGKHGYLPWIALSSKQKNCTWQYCPECLREMNVRLLLWRVAFVTFCPAHNCWLIMNGDQQDRPPPDDGTMNRQQALLDILERGWVRLGDFGPQYSFVWFEMLFWVCRLMLNGGKGQMLFDVASAESGIWMERPQFPDSVRQSDRIYTLPAWQRARLIEIGYWLLDDWPVRLVHCLREVRFDLDRLKSSRGRRERVPYALQEGVFAPLDQGLHIPSPGEINAVKAWLRKQGRVATRRNIQKLTGWRLNEQAVFHECVPGHAPSGTGRYWKLDGVSPVIRQRVRQLAARENQLISAVVEQFLREGLEKQKGSQYVLPHESGARNRA